MTIIRSRYLYGSVIGGWLVMFRARQEIARLPGYRIPLLVAWLLVLLWASYVWAAGPDLRFFPERFEYITWDRLRLYVQIDNVGRDVMADMYLLIITPEGRFFCLVPDLSFSGLMVDRGVLKEADWADPSSLVAAARGLFIATCGVLPKTLVYKAVLRYDYNLAGGEYWLLGLLCQPNSLTPLSVSIESFHYEPKHCTVCGRIFDETGPASSALVKIRTTPNEVLSDRDGNFCLFGVECGKRVMVSGWEFGHYCTFAEAESPTTSVVLKLDPVTPVDNEEYEWIAPDPPRPGGLTCMTCQVPAHQQWSANFHAMAADNIFVQTLYTGTDVYGNPNKGPGYKLDFPDTAGSCALCHAPAAALRAPWNSDMTRLDEMGRRGVFCDFCHKIYEVDLSNLGSVYGVNAIRLRRPFPDRWVVFGPLNDAGRLSSYHPLYHKSEFCAPCHSCDFWGVPIYTSFPEWQASPYKEMGIQCQDCHYRPTGDVINVAPMTHCRERDPDNIPSHMIMGRENISLHRESAFLSIDARVEADGSLVATVGVLNAFAGHYLPTGRPIRNIILLVDAYDASGEPLEFVGDQVVPIYGGAGGGPRDYAGRPGKMFAKILVDQMGNHPAPSWRQTMILSDTRIPPLETDLSTYEFAMPTTGSSATVEARLIYRRAFKGLADEKGWDMEDVLMTSESTRVFFEKR